MQRRRRVGGTSGALDGTPRVVVKAHHKATRTNTNDLGARANGLRRIHETYGARRLWERTATSKILVTRRGDFVI